MIQLKGQSREPDVLDMGTPFAIKADQMHLLAPYKVTQLEQHPGQRQGHRRHLVGRLRRVRGHRLQLRRRKDPADLVQVLLNPDVQEQVAHKQQPDGGRCGVRGRVRGGAGQWWLVRQHRPRASATSRSSSQEGNFVPVISGAVDGRERGHPPSSSGGTTCRRRRSSPRCRRLEGRHPERRPSTPPTTTRPSSANGPAPRGRPAVGGVPVLDGRPEPVAAGLLPPDRAVHPGQERDRQRDGLQGAAAGPAGFKGVPDQRPGHGG